MTESAYHLVGDHSPEAIKLADASLAGGKAALLKLFQEYAAFRNLTVKDGLHPLVVPSTIDDIFQEFGADEFRLLLTVALGQLYTTHRFVGDLLRYATVNGLDIMARMEAGEEWRVDDHDTEPS